MTEADYQVEPAKSWHKTRLSAEEWFERNPPHRWRSVKDAIDHYTASGFTLTSASTSHAIFAAPSRYTTRRAVFWCVALGVPTLGAAIPVVGWWFIAKIANEEKPWITIREDYEHGTGLYVEERKAGDRPVHVPGMLA